MATNYPINPRVRAFGKARIDIASRAKNQAQWEQLWKHPANSFPFAWGESWKQCIEYRVDDFPAEIGFYIDILGLSINALDSGYAMFTSPQGDFFFSVVPTPHTEQSTPPDAFRLQFMVKDIIATTQVLQQRGIDFEQAPQPLRPGSSLSIASFRTPHGICVELWGKVEAGKSTEVELSLSKAQDNEDEVEDEDSNEIEDDDDEGELERDEELSDDSDGDPGDDSDDDEEQDGFEFDKEDDEFEDDEDDEDDDDFDDSEDSAALKSDPRKSIALNPPTLHLEAKTESIEKMPDNKNMLGPEYIDLDIT